MRRVGYEEMVARGFVVGVASAPPHVVELLHAAIGDDVELVAISSPTVDLVLLGPRLDWQLLDKLTARGQAVLLLAETRDESAEYRAIEHGASGYLVLSTPPATLRRTIWAALAGEPVFHRSVLGRWLRAQGLGPRERSEATHVGLTPRQQQILGLIAQGATTKEIAGRLRIRNSTVDKHISNLLKRVGVSNRAAAVGALGWTAPQPPGNPGTRELVHELEEEEEPVSHN